MRRPPSWLLCFAPRSTWAATIPVHVARAEVQEVLHEAKPRLKVPGMPPDLITGGFPRHRKRNRTAPGHRRGRHRLQLGQPALRFRRACCRNSCSRPSNVFSPCNVAVPDDVRRLWTGPMNLVRSITWFTAAPSATSGTTARLSRDKRPAGCLTHPWPILATQGIQD